MSNQTLAADFPWHSHRLPALSVPCGNGEVLALEGGVICLMPHSNMSVDFNQVSSARVHFLHPTLCGFQKNSEMMRTSVWGKSRGCHLNLGFECCWESPWNSNYFSPGGDMEPEIPPFWFRFFALTFMVSIIPDLSISTQLFPLPD